MSMYEKLKVKKTIFAIYIEKMNINYNKRNKLKLYLTMESIHF